MGEKAEAEILKEVRGMRADMEHMRNEVTALKSELSGLRQRLDADAEREAIAEIRRLWAEGLASGDAGELDEVMDRLIKEIPTRTPDA